MIGWIEVLTILAVMMAILGIVLAFAVLVNLARRMIPKKPSISLEQIKKKEKPKMSKDTASEGVTFNDIFMFMIAVPLVLLWVGFAGFVIHSGLQDDSVLEQIEGYTTLIAILGGPALLIIKDALDVWKQEQAEKTAFYKIKAQAVIDYNDHAQKQAQMIEAKAQEQEHKMQSKK
jgi:H+/gluconate symporter-like permease